jgi:Family of unknown function (DUF5522)
MQKELSYLSPEGFTIFTSQFHRNRGSCCKSACLHCPYGYTFKKSGIQFSSVDEKDLPMVEKILDENAVSETEWKKFFPENLKLIKIKDVVAGLVLKNHIVIKYVYLRKEFRDQGLSRELLESYMFI